jgi:adenosylhomocysteine nucleosidase
MTELMILAAADWELEPFVEALDNPNEIRRAAWTYWKGQISGRRVVVARTDWGPINAVAATITGIDAFRPAAIICQGMAGAHSPGLAVGDVIVAESCVDIGAYKSDPSGRRTPLEHRLRRDGALKPFPCFEADARMMAAALRVPNSHGRVLRGRAGSAYQYHRDKSTITELHGTDCEDMESAFAAGAAALIEVPFLAVRMISNSVWGDGALDKSVGRKCAEFVLRIER